MVGGGVYEREERGGGCVVEAEKEDVRREYIAQEGILVSNQRECLCELSLSVGVMLEGLGGGGTHCGSGGLLGFMRRRRSLLLDGAKEGSH